MNKPSPDNQPSAVAVPANAVSELRIGRVMLAAAGVLSFAFATGLAAQLRVPVPGSPVPMTLQTLVVLLAGVALGPRLGVLSMLFYLALGISGHQVFALSSLLSHAGFAYLLGPTGGYLLGFVAAAGLVGWLTRSDRGSMTIRAARLAFAALAGHVLIFALGVAWLRVWSGGEWSAALAAGLLPFIGATIAKSAAAVPLGLILARLVRGRVAI